MRILSRKKIPGGESVIIEHGVEDGYRGPQKVHSTLTVTLHEILPDTWWNRLRVRLRPNQYRIDR